MRNALPTGISLRPITDHDKVFMAALYAANRQAELANFPFNDQQKTLFLQSQFEAQYRHYFTHYPSQRFTLIEQQGQPVGRLLVAEHPDHLRLVDIALLPSHQGLGIGSALLRQLQAEATTKALAIKLQVAPASPAQRLYQRLGFVAGEGDAFYLAMTWLPQTIAPAK
ncbi:GNAT family N-acetyltransferase [Gallaecimonas pentaromativorans]|uniref:Ribosomal protein S18 acetylase RimI-like enzyme n=1 Tax=Gallaecimonas pentaromativorans TaxID=584787 RepID=A0A3N1NWW0_9GAMM|nr:GNAT family N-acetyltransferase [Gallaecimonas pentaromativorans]ROQ18920.1 ribosomal protein S18 acetylase RimI-like enzyme [Gallaecimonas pentaromativorans]